MCSLIFKKNGRVYVLCVEWAPDGSQLVSGGEYGEIKLWSPTGVCLNTLKGHRYLRWFVPLRKNLQLKIGQ
jgi:WD40 repeat protein